MVVQVPPWTNFHALPWKSAVDVPWQVVPGPAAQSFWPFSATPKHFSLCAATAASASALVIGAAAARLASAVVLAPARMRELTTVFIGISIWIGIALVGEAVLSRSSRLQPSLRFGRSRIRETVSENSANLAT